MSQTATKIVLRVLSTLTQGKTETAERFKARQSKNTSELTLYTGMTKDKRTKAMRQETIGERVYRAITELDNPVYEIVKVEGPLTFSAAN